VKKKRLLKNCCFHTLPLILVMALSFSPCASATALEESEDAQAYSITEPYEYGIDLDSDEWKNSSLSERVADVYVSDDVVENMSTQALTITVLCNPFLSDFWAFDNYEQAMEIVSHKVNGLTELLTREDVLETISLIASDEELFTSALIDYGSDETNIEILSMKLELLNTLTSVFAGTESDSFVSSCEDAALLQASKTTVPTPNGSSVKVISGLTYADHSTTLSAVKAAQTSLLGSYSSATVVRDVSSATAAYNCHSYAWYSTSSSNSYWMCDPSTYMTDGSYISGTAKVGSKITYTAVSSGTIIHSAIVSKLSSGSTPVTVKSKWGRCGVISHYTNDCPYTDTSEYGSIRISTWNAS